MKQTYSVSDGPIRGCLGFGAVNWVGWLVAFLLGGSGCIPSEHYVLLQHQEKDSLMYEDIGQYEPYSLQPGDVVVIQVVSAEKEASRIFNLDPVTGRTIMGNSAEANNYLGGFTVSEEGDIILPTLGKWEAAGKTLRELQAELETRINQKYLKDATVTVRFGNFRVTMLGEVNRPGTFNFYNEKTHLLQAIGNANGLTDFANRRRVRIVRRKEGGTQEYVVDLTDKEALRQPKYVLQPNDVVYIEPLPAKIKRKNLASNNLWLPTVISLSGVLATLIIRL